jgi:hypothetical protein
MSTLSREKYEHRLHKMQEELNDLARVSPPNDGSSKVEDAMEQRERHYLNEFADFHEDYLTHNIMLADSKAGVLATATAGLVGFLLSQSQFRAALAAQSFTIDWWLSRATVTTLGLAFILAFIVIAPRIDRSARNPANFAQVAKLPSAKQFLADLDERGPDGIAEWRITNCFETAKVCALKYTYLRRAMFLAALGALLTAIGFVRFGS